MSSSGGRFSLFEEDDNREAGIIHLRILATSDVYDFGNWARFYAAVKELSLEKEDGYYNLLLLPGDFLAPSVISCVDQGHSMVDCLNEIGFQYCIFGNHESDVTISALGDRIRESKFTWINSNMFNLPDNIPTLPEYVKLNFASHTQSRSIALIGLLTDDKYLYRKGAFGGAKIKPVVETALRLHERLKDEVDCVIPLTHQSMAHDRHLALVSGGKFPVIIGGHDHSPFTETVAGVPIIKAGIDAINVAITDIVWPSPDSCSPDVSIQIVPVKRFEPDLKISKIVHDHQSRVLGSLDAAHIVSIRENVILSSKNLRVEQRTMGRMMASLLRDSLLGDCCILPSGTIRRGHIYDATHTSFTYRDLVSELPFEDEVVVVDFPGHVIEAAIKFSHGPLRKGMGGYMQVDSGIELDEDSNIVMINGQNFEPNRLYRLVTHLLELEGLDENIPLINHFNLPVSEGGFGAKEPQEGDPRRCPLKLALHTVIARRRFTDIWSESWKRGPIEFLSKESFCGHDINRGAPEWFIDQLFNQVDWDNDGKIDFVDAAISFIFCWLSGPISGVEEDHTYRIDATGMTSSEELRAHLETVIPKGVASDILADMIGGSAFVTRSDITSWLDKLKLK